MSSFPANVPVGWQEQSVLRDIVSRILGLKDFTWPYDNQSESVCPTLSVGKEAGTAGEEVEDSRQIRRVGSAKGSI